MKVNRLVVALAVVPMLAAAAPTRAPVFRLIVETADAGQAAVEIPDGVKIANDPDAFFEHASVRIETEGPVAVMALVPDVAGPQFVMFRSATSGALVEDLRVVDSPYEPDDPRSLEVPAGSYTIYLLSESPARASVAMEGLAENITVPMSATVLAGHEAIEARASTFGPDRAWTARRTFSKPSTMFSLSWAMVPDPATVFWSTQACAYDALADEDLVWLPGCPTGETSRPLVQTTAPSGFFEIHFAHSHRDKGATVGSSWTVMQDPDSETIEAGLVQAWWPSPGTALAPAR